MIKRDKLSGEINEDRRNKMTKKILMAMVVVFLSMPIYGVVSGNWGCGPLIPDGCQNRSNITGLSSVKSGYTIGQIIAEGTYYYTLANSKYQELLSKIEISELRGYDFLELKTIVDVAIKNMYMAKHFYKEAFDMASQCECDEKYLLKLREFDYDTFQQKNNLIPSVLEKTRDYLSTGNIKGVFEVFAVDSLNIHNLLITIKSHIDIERIPEYHLIWECNQRFFITHLFGQYVSMVFYNLR